MGRGGWLRLWDLTRTHARRVIIWDAYASPDGKVLWIHFMYHRNPRMYVTSNPLLFGRREGSLI